ncbi:MAG TPA: N-acetylmuramoyl-L-alanine amidase [Steroidobacteraceae bacterium]|nr:N-acetylmuramoyl-L-alanine amidase [Steroidobacteraceae bacterium]
MGKRLGVWFALLASVAGVSGNLVAAEIRDIRVSATETGTRVVLDLSGPVKHTAFLLDDPGRVVLDVSRSSLKSKMPGAEGAIIAVRSGKLPHNGLRLVFEVTGVVTIQTADVLPAGGAGHRLVLDIVNSAIDASGARSVAVTPAAPAVPVAIRPAHAPSESGRDIVIAVDAGHGGVDPGASGKRGTHEKDVVLEIAKALAARINSEPGMKAVLTRDGDYFISLRERNTRARRAKADLFVSIHADAIANPDVSGSSVYVLSDRGASSEAARWLAERENAADLKGGIKLDDKDAMLANVLLDLSQTASISASMVAADNVLKSLDRIGEVRKPRVQQAGFVVLKSPDIPSMLVETAFISNREDERKLSTPAHRSKLANAIFAGIEQYFQGNAPDGTRLAANRRNAGTGTQIELRK